MFTSQTLFKSESLGDKIKKQRQANEDLKAKIAIRDKQIAQNKQKIESLEKEKKDKKNFTCNWRFSGNRCNNSSSRHRPQAGNSTGLSPPTTRQRRPPCNSSRR